MRLFSANMQKATLSSFCHDIRDGDVIPAYIDSKFTKNNELSISSSKIAIEKFEKNLRMIQDAYVLKYGKPPRKFQSNQSLLQEVVLSIDKHVHMEHVKKCAKWLEDTYGFTSLLCAIHKDEGEDVANGKINYHAHIILLDLDKDCKSIRRKLKIADMKLMQTEMARICNMKRGIDYVKTYKTPAKFHTSHISGRHFAGIANSIKNTHPSHGSMHELIINSDLYKKMSSVCSRLISNELDLKKILQDYDEYLMQNDENYLLYYIEEHVEENLCKHYKQKDPLVEDIAKLIFFQKQDILKLKDACKDRNAQIGSLKHCLSVKEKKIERLESKIKGLEKLVLKIKKPKKTPIYDRVNISDEIPLN